MLKYLERLQQEDMENLQKKRQVQKSLMEEVAKCNEVRRRREGGQGWGSRWECVRREEGREEIAK